MKSMNERNAPINIGYETFRQNGHYLIDQIAAFLELLPKKSVTKGEQPREIKSFLGNHSLPVNGAPLNVILQDALGLLTEHSLFNGHPRFWGYITSSPAPAGILAELLAAAINPNVGAYILSPMATEIERQTIRWIAEFIGYPKDSGGIFVSGGNMANITGLLAARKAKANWDIRKTGLGSRKMLIYCANGTHTWIQKGADLLGFGTDNIRWIENHGDQRMNVSALEEQILNDQKAGHLPFIVVGTAGSVSTGVVDPLEEISEICKRYGLWFHVDGAYGVPAAAVPEVSPLFEGLEKADSVALDPHKWFYSPLEAGCILVKNEQSLQDAFSFHPVYYNFDGKEDDPVVNFLEEGFQNSRGFRALKVWVTLKQVGKEGYIRMMRDDIQLAKELFERAQSHKELEAVSHHLSIAAFRFVPEGLEKNADSEAYLNKLNEAIVNRIQAGGEAFISNAVVGNKYCLRACIVNFRTGLEDVEALVSLVVRIGRAVYNEMKAP